MKIPFLSLFKAVEKRVSLNRGLFFWYRHHNALFFLCFFIVLSIGSWRWYYSLYQYRFSDEEKKQYIEANFEETVFKESKFRDVVDRLTERTRKHEEPLELKRDIFKGK